MVEIIRMGRSQKSESLEEIEKGFDPVEVGETLTILLQTMVKNPEKVRIEEKVEGKITAYVVYMDLEDSKEFYANESRLLWNIRGVFSHIGSKFGQKIEIHFGKVSNPDFKVTKRSRNYQNRSSAT